MTTKITVEKVGWRSVFGLGEIRWSDNDETWVRVIEGTTATDDTDCPICFGDIAAGDVVVEVINGSYADDYHTGCFPKAGIYDGPRD